MIDLDLPQKINYKKMNFRITEGCAAQFDLYVKAAKEKHPDVTEGEVMEAILNKQIGKDKKFKTWLKDHKSK